MSEMSIGFNSSGVNNKHLTNNTDAAKKETTNNEVSQQQVPAKPQVSEANTFAYMGSNPAAMAAMANIHFVSQPKTTVDNVISDTIFSDDVASHIAAEALIAAANAMPAEQKARIEASMGNFQEGVVSYVPLVEEELGATASEPAVLAVAAGMLLNDDE